MMVFKICQEKYSKKLSASGAANRWNKRDEFVIYTGHSISLSTLELVAHRSGIVVSKPYKLLEIELQPEDILELDIKKLPANWQSISAYSHLQEIGSEWYHSEKSLILKVPSAIIPQESNYIINTRHTDFLAKVKLIKTTNFEWDKRLL